MQTIFKISWWPFYNCDEESLNLVQIFFNWDKKEYFLGDFPSSASTVKKLETGGSVTPTAPLWCWLWSSLSSLLLSFLCLPWQLFTPYHQGTFLEDFWRHFLVSWCCEIPKRCLKLKLQLNTFILAPYFPSVLLDMVKYEARNANKK